jgi:protein BCP1
MSKTTKRKKGTDSDSSDGEEPVSWARFIRVARSDLLQTLIDVDFEFFDPNPSVDYQAIKQLLTQTFQSDAHLFHLHDLTDLILSQPLVGTTVKTDGKESDPFAVLTVLNMLVHRVRATPKFFLELTILRRKGTSIYQSFG